MNSDDAPVPVVFAKQFLENTGGVLEETSHGFEALLPPDLSERLGTREYIRVEGERDIRDEGLYAINYGSPLLERMVEIACAKVPIATCRLTFEYLKTQGFDRLISEQFSFHKATRRIISSAVTRTEYLVLTFRYLAQSDEQKQGLITMALHPDTGAIVPQMDLMLSLAARDFSPFVPQASAEALHKISKSIQFEVEAHLEEELSPFKESMDRRFRRDVKNLEAYYGALRKEMEESLRKSLISEQLIQDRRDKIALLPDEMARKKDDLFKKYSIRVKITPCAGMLVATSAVKLLLEVLVGKTKRQISLLYNPVTKRMDPLVCQGCGRSIMTVSFCDRMHLLCLSCRHRCPLCWDLRQGPRPAPNE
ncbi:MAG: hypothetical protein AB1512_21285 [Thermodesulfobacteriota bacterium]